MEETAPQTPNPKSPAGYRPLLPADMTRGVGPAAYLYVAAAVGFGLTLGVAGAMMANHSKVAAAPSISASLTTHTSGLAMLPASFAGPAPTLLSQVAPQNKPTVAPGILTRVSDKATTRRHHGRRKHGIHKAVDMKKGAKAHKGAFRKPYVSPNAEAAAQAPDQPTALQLANTAAASGPFFLGIQGDVTVANYDAASGTIQTYEGETYLLAKNGADTNSIPWQDYPFNVHFRCDEIGNCTLSHAGASAIAKLTR